MHRISVLFVWLLLQCTVSFSQKNYIDYYTWVNQAEEAYVNGSVDKCFGLYDKAFATYREPFLKDTYIAAQLAYATGDTAHFWKYMTLAFKNGFPLTAFHAASILDGISDGTPEYIRVVELYHQYKDYKKVNQTEKDVLYRKTYHEDSLAMFMGHNPDLIKEHAVFEVEYRKFIMDNYLSKGVFPGERMIGVFTEDDYDAFLERNHLTNLFDMFAPKSTQGSAKQFTLGKGTPGDYMLINNTAYPPFVHYTCTFEKYSKELWAAVLNGYLHPKTYGMLQETSVAWNRNRDLSVDKCDYPPKDCYYNIIPFNPTSQYNTFTSDAQFFPEIETNREHIYVQKYSVDKQKAKLEKEKGFKFFFGFLNLM